MCVSRESIFSGLNNIGVYSILNYDVSDKFESTENEVKQILTDFKLSENYDNVRQWYDGYKFGQTENIYNPWPILNYAAKPYEGVQNLLGQHQW